MTEALIVFSTFANEADAARVARVLVEERLVACAQLVPGARSIYRWQDEVREDAEVVVLMKTRKQDWTALLSRLHELHPYETPECIAVRVAAGAPKYMAWLDEALAPEASARSSDAFCAACRSPSAFAFRPCNSGRATVASSPRAVIAAVTVPSS